MLNPRTEATRPNMPLAELLRPLSAKVQPRSALIDIHGCEMSEDEARAQAHYDQRLRPNTRIKGAHK
ncbi:hypothetical protein O4H61_03495 [Roseovarius aestuarii]|nr:hypothetical protein [Roseovarius aestuarii]